MIAQTPPMGWNSWDCWGAAVNEETVRRNAEYMARRLKPFGWEYVVVDIQWYEPGAVSHDYRPFAELEMDAYGRLLPAPNRFPSAAGGRGFAPLAEYVHSLGLKFGIHIMRGIPRMAAHRRLPVLGTDKTADEIADPFSICPWNSDMYGVNAGKDGAAAYYESIFRLYAAWGVDFIKCDDIAREMPRCEAELRLLSRALRGCGREMVLSLSPGPALPEFAPLYRETANMWRITDDFWDEWKPLYNMFARAEMWCAYAEPGHWPDADMLPIGPIRQIEGRENRSRFTEEEARTMMTLWAMLRSPLMIGADMPGLTAAELSLLTNRGILELHKNGRLPHPLYRMRDGGTEWILWTARLPGGGTVLAVFNAGEKDGAHTVPLDHLGIAAGAKAQELWSGETAFLGDTLTAAVPHHGVRVYRIS